MVSPKGRLNEMSGFVCVRCSTDDEVNHRLRDLTGAWERLCLSLSSAFEIERLQTPKSHESALRRNFAVEQFTGKLPWPLHRFQQNKVYKHCSVYTENGVLVKIDTLTRL